MFKILCIVGGFFFIALVVFVCHFACIIYKDEDVGYKNTIIDWIKQYHKDWRNWAHLKFNEWKKYYILAPEQWRLTWFSPKRTIRDKKGLWDTVYINFGFIGNIRYVLFKHNMDNKYEKNKAAQNSQNNLRYILEAVQEDIEILKKQSKEEINKAAETTKKVKENLDKQKLRKMKTGYNNDPPYSIFRYDDVEF